jgi:1-acyl-sn-glycerol-3-phosphate acyltransferase
VFYKMMHLFLNILFVPFFSMTIQNKENIPKDKNYIIVSNHVSNFDPLLLALAWEKPVHFMAKQELFEIFFIGRVLKWLQMIPVRRGESDRKAVKEALQYLKDGEILALFPEGTRNKEKIGLLPFHTGAAFFAKTTDLAILPVAISGTTNIRPSFFNRINFKVGRAIEIGDHFEGKISSKELDDFTQILRSEIEHLLGDSYESNKN